MNWNDTHTHRKNCFSHFPSTNCKKLFLYCVCVCYLQNEYFPWSSFVLVRRCCYRFSSILLSCYFHLSLRFRKIHRLFVFDFFQFFAFEANVSTFSISHRLALFWVSVVSASKVTTTKTIKLQLHSAQP